MVFLPIVHRELRVASRRSGTYWIRVSVAMLALLIGAWIMMMPGLNSARELGQALFYSLSTITYIYALITGIRVTADALSEEKREGTLGLLFLTDLKGYDIVFGKLAATSLNALYGMVAIFPVLAIPLLAGGVTIEEFGRVVIASLNAMFFSLAAGMFASAISRDDRKSAGLTLLIVLVMAIILPLVGIIRAEVTNGKPHPMFFIPSPGYSCFMAFEDVYTSNKTFNFFYQSIATVQGLSWSLLLLACYVVPKTWQEKAHATAGEGSRRGLRAILLGSPESRLRLRRHFLSINPIFWLESRYRLKTLSLWIFLIFMALLWAWGLWKYPRESKDPITYFWSVLIAHTLIKSWVATESCRRFVLDRQSGAFELLLSTPITVKQIIQGQLLALWRYYSIPAALILGADIVFMMAERREQEWVAMCATAIVILIADLVALSWVGMWMGLCAKRVNRAAAAAMVRILVLPWAILLLLLSFLAIMSFRRPSMMPEFETVVALFAFISIAIDVAFGLWARQKLYSQFRQVATSRFQPGAPPPASEPERATPPKLKAA